MSTPNPGFREKFKDKAETVQKDGSTRKESASFSQPARLQTSQRKAMATANQVQVIGGGPRVVAEPSGSLHHDSSTSKHAAPVVHTSHHSPTLGVSARPAEGIPSNDPAEAPGRPRRLAPLNSEVNLQRKDSERNSPSPEDPVDEYFHRRDRRLPPLPDFKSPPPIVHGRKLREPDPEPILGDYRPHSLKDYKRMQEDYAKHRFGGLGPSDSEEKQRAREKFRKMLEYGDAVNAVNFTMMDGPPPKQGPPQPIPRKLDRTGQLGLIKRQRALKYGEQFSHQNYRDKAAQKTVAQSAQLEAELKKLTEKHQHDAAEIAKLKQLLQLEER